MINRLAAALFGLASMLAAAPAMAEHYDYGLRDFCADRPGKGTPTCILDQGHWQVELGLFDGGWQKTDDFKVESLAYGDTFIRYGVDGQNEIQSASPPTAVKRSPTAPRSTARSPMASATSRSASAIPWPVRTAAGCRRPSSASSPPRPARATWETTASRAGSSCPSPWR